MWMVKVRILPPQPIFHDFELASFAGSSRIFLKWHFELAGLGSFRFRFLSERIGRYSRQMAMAKTIAIRDVRA
jgi:hypothetical protein